MPSLSILTFLLKTLIKRYKIIQETEFGWKSFERLAGEMKIILEMFIKHSS